MKPDFIGLGAQKCATAWLYSILDDHPQICMAKTTDGEKDIQFFNSFYDRGFEWYENHFVKQGNDITGEYSTSYFYSLEAPERIYSYSPNIKLILSLRHPVERAFSNHKHEIKQGRISGKNLIFENGLKNNPMYTYQSLYYTHLKRWLHYFDRTQIFIILVDELRKDPKRTIHDLYDFLCVDNSYDPAMLGQRIHETRLPKSILFEQLIKKTSVFVKSIGGTRLVDYLKSRGVNRKIYKLNSMPEYDAFSPMQDETRTYLLNYFQDENKKLAELIGKDLLHWNK